MAAPIFTMDGPGLKWFDDTSSLASRLTDRTKSYQTQLMKEPFFVHLLDQGVSKRHYEQYLVDLHLIYATLESEIARLQNINYIKKLTVPSLCRAKELKSDLDFLESVLTPTGKALKYASYIEETARQEPWKLVAHAYVRYFCLLINEDLLKPRVASLFGQECANFYDLQAYKESCKLRTAQAHKDFYLNLFNHLPLNDSQKSGVVAETEVAFAYAADSLSALDVFSRSGNETF